MFEPVPNQVDLVEQEHRVLDFWKRSDAFRKLQAKNQGNATFSFIDGPITANNPMGVHHAWGRTYKDIFQRYRAMRGMDERWQNGFDCQGLWVEVEVEKERGFQSKRDIEEFGLAEFVNLCKQRVLEYSAVQTAQSIRLGYWMDWNDPEQLRELGRLLNEDPDRVITVEGPQGPVTDTVEQIVARLGLAELGGSYFTFSNENNYLIWGFLKQCHEHGWLYKGKDVMPWCPRCGTSLSSHEVAQGYRDVIDPSVYVRFPVIDPQGPLKDGDELIVWTTTPWTLVSNAAVAVDAGLTYVRARLNAPGGPVFQAHMVLAYYAKPDAEPVILDNLDPSIQPASRRTDLLPVFKFNSERIYQTGAGNARSVGVGQLSRWADALRRIRIEGFD